MALITKRASAKLLESAKNYEDIAFRQCRRPSGPSTQVGPRIRLAEIGFERAQRIYEEIIRGCPETEMVRRAQQRLDKIGDLRQLVRDRIAADVESEALKGWEKPVLDSQ